MGAGERLPDEDGLCAIAETFASMGADLESQDTSDTLEAVAGAAVDRIPGARWASITSYVHDSFRTVAATHDVARRADALQYAVGSGPCVDAIVDDALYCPRDIAHDDRWPEYGRRVSSEVGIRSMLSYRLAVEVGDAIHGLNVYSDGVGAFSERSRLVGLMLATHGALAAALVANQERVEHLRRALSSNREIGIAMGVLMARHQITREQAFDLLRMASQNSNRKLHDVAVGVADTGVLPPLTGSRPRRAAAAD